MKRLLLSLLFATPLLAQTADLRVSIDVAAGPVQHGDVIPYTATVENLGPDTATGVQFRAGSGESLCTDQRIPALAPGERRTVHCQTIAPFSGFSVGIHAYTQSEIADPDRRNNEATVILRIVTPPDLMVYSFPEHVVDAGLPFSVPIGYANRSHTDATNVVITLKQVRGVRRLPDNCSFANNEVTCAIGTVPGIPLGGFPDFRTFGVEVIAPDASNQQIPIVLEIKGDQADAVPDSNVYETSTRTYRTFFVTNTNDDGSGSLRAAIHEANASCREAGFCKIAFRIPPTGAKWQTITPVTPLPLLLAPAIDVDALVQARYFADTNDAGPEIELSGAALREGHGLEFACGVSIRGLAINGFPGSGIHSSKATCPPVDEGRINLTRTIQRNYLGTDPTGMTAMPNLRGIHLDAAGVEAITENVISGNLRSGIFIDSANTAISRNMIGLNRVPNAGLGNGASGIYLGEHSDGSDVSDNYIGFNAHFGVSLHPHARYNAFSGNSFQANHNQAIDFGLDGPTEAVPDASNNGTVVRPEITSARYDPLRDETIIEGSSRTTNDRYEVWVNLYANDERDPSGYGEGQYYLGAVKAAQDMSFRFTRKGRPPGRWIAATTTRINIIGFARTPEVQSICGCGFTSTTSEFGRTVEVE